MTFINSRLVVSLFIFMVSLGAAYGMLQPLTHDSARDPSQKLHTELNDAFAKYWKERTGTDVSIRQARSKSGKTVDATVDGLDITALDLSYDGNTLGKKARFIPPEWKPLPQNSPYASPYISTIVFLVRKGNPKGLKDWDDLLRPGVEILASNPESEDGRWSYLAAWGYALKQSDGDEAVAREFVKNLFANVKLPDSEPGKGDAMISFIEGDIGDLLLAWENEAHLLVREKGADKLEIVVPSMSIAAERSISVTASGRSGARDVAAAYIDYLYTRQAQDIAARHYYRPRDPLTNAKYGAQFPPLALFTIDEVFGGWRKVEQIHFAKGRFFEQIQSN